MKTTTFNPEFAKTLKIMIMTLFLALISFSAMCQVMALDENNVTDNANVSEVTSLNQEPATGDSTVVIDLGFQPDRRDLLLIPPDKLSEPWNRIAGDGYETSLGRRITFHSGFGYNNPMCPGVPAFSIGISVTIF